MLDADHTPSATPAPTAETARSTSSIAAQRLDELAARRADLMRPRSLLSNAEWQEWLATADVDVATTPTEALERLYDLERDLHWRDACGRAQIEGHSAFLDEEPAEANPYAGDPTDKEWDEDGRGYRSLQSSCAFLWDMGWREGRFSAQLEQAYELLAAGDAAAAEATLKDALKKYDER